MKDVPIDTLAPGKPAAPAAPLAPPDLPQVLLVDDQPARLLTYEAILAGANVRCVRALSGFEALELLMKQQFALIVMDVSMPGMDGFETARLVREHPRFEKTPIIFVTGVHISEFDRLKGYEVGAIDYISVPVVPEILRSKVAILVELYLRRTQLQLLNCELEEARAQLKIEHSRAMKANEARLRSIFENPAQLTVVLEPQRAADGSIVDWRCTDANAWAAEMLGLNPTDLIGKAVGELFPHRVAHVFPLYQAVLASGVPTQYQTVLRGRDMLVSLSRIDDNTLIVAGLDVTERRQAELALRESEERFRSVFFDAGVGMALIEKDATIRMVNPAFCAVLGRGTDELLGASCLAFTHPDDVQASLLRLGALVNGSGKTASFEKRFVRKDGLVRWAQVNIVRVSAGAGVGERLLAVVEDISERAEVQRGLEDLSRQRGELLEAERAARSEAETAMRAKDEFLATLSHELRTPLSNVISWARVLQRKHSGSSADLDRGLRIIVDNAMAQAQLISDLLDMSRLAAGKITLHAQPINMNELVGSAVDAQRHAAEAKGLTFELAASEGPAYVLGDSTRLQQVVWNLLSNAVKFTPAGEGKIIHVRTRTTKSHVEIEVADPGEGLDPAFIPHLFARFRQGDPGISRRHGGLGLGLALVKQLIEMHGGDALASSAGPGMGATFTVRVPRHEGDTGVSPAPADTSDSLERPLAGLRVLAVEDQPIMREYLEQALKEHGAEVLTASCADAALKILKESGSSIDMLVSDIGMPELDGHQFIRIVRQTLRISADMLPALALTAFAREEDQARSILHGYQAHLSKPYQIQELVSTVRELVAAAKAASRA